MYIADHYMFQFSNLCGDGRVVILKELICSQSCRRGAQFFAVTIAFITHMILCACVCKYRGTRG